MTDWKAYAKAIVGGIVAALSAAIPVLEQPVTSTGIITIVLAFIAGLGIVYAVPNAKRAAK